MDTDTRISMAWSVLMGSRPGPLFKPGAGSDGPSRKDKELFWHPAKRLLKHAEDKMRFWVIGLLVPLGVAVAVSTAAAPLPGRSEATVAAPSVEPIAHNCPPGQRWVPAGYAKHAKYRPARCVPR